MNQLSTTTQFGIDYVRAQGPTRTHLRKRFGHDMKNFLAALSEPLDAVARIGMANDIGTRNRNEDSAVAMLGHLGDDHEAIPVILAAVADGNGGHKNGDLAGALALQALTENVVDEMQYRDDDKIDKMQSASNIEDLLTEAVTAAHYTIKAETDGGGSTLTCALILGDTAHIAHVGDSRAYLLHDKRRAIELLTRDHRLVREWADFGLITQEQARHHPQAHILFRSLGKQDQCEVDIVRCDLEQGSRLLLCTDGISDVLNRNEIYAIANRSDHPQDTCERLIKAAVAQDTRDDVTAVLVEIPG